MYGPRKGTKDHQNFWLRESDPQRYLGMASKSTQAYLDAFKANVDDWYAGKIEFEAFSERQRELWRELESADAETLAGVRAGLLNALHG